MGAKSCLSTTCDWLVAAVVVLVTLRTLCGGGLRTILSFHLADAFPYWGNRPVLILLTEGRRYRHACGVPPLISFQSRCGNERRERGTPGIRREAPSRESDNK